MPPCPCCPPVSGIARRAFSSASRRAFLATAFAAATLPAVASAAGGPPHTSLTADQALARLLEGNERHLAGATLRGLPDAARTTLLTTGQAPFAAILGCADSRATPELLFQLGLGELFVVRNAGNIADTGAIGSVEYAVAALGVPLVMVLGHESCGAAGAALGIAQQDPALPGRVREMVLPMLPAALAALRQGGDVLDGTVRGNAIAMAARLVAESPVIGPAVAGGRVKVVAARFDLDEQRVQLL